MKPELERAIAAIEARARELDAWEKEMAGDRSWSNVRGEGMRQAIKIIQELDDDLVLVPRKMTTEMKLALNQQWPRIQEGWTAAIAAASK